MYWSKSCDSVKGCEHLPAIQLEGEADWSWWWWLCIYSHSFKYGKYAKRPVFLLLTSSVIHAGFPEDQVAIVRQMADSCDFDAWVTSIGSDGIRIHKNVKDFDSVDIKVSAL